jgi:hypothetical protein
LIQTDQLPVETPKSSPIRRRLRVAIVAVITVALVIPFVWHRPSQLTETERRIVGEWTVVNSKDRRMTQRVHFRPDRTFSYWETEVMHDDGTWKTSGKELTFVFSRDEWVPRGILDRIFDLIFLIQHPRNWGPNETRLSLDEVSPTAIHVRDSDGTKILFQRSGAVRN